MCETCLAQCDDYGEVLPGWYLVRATKDSGWRMEAGDWGLVQCNDPSFVFTTTPVKDPTVGLSDEELDAKNPELDKQHEEFINAVENIGRDMFDSVDMSVSSIPLYVYGKLYTACINGGASGSRVLHWLCNHIATYLEGNPNVRRWQDEYPTTDTGE